MHRIHTAKSNDQHTQMVPLLNGERVRYINLDNAASTTALPQVWRALERYVPYYASVHRGTGFTSRLSTAAYEQAHDIVGRFVGADLATNTVIFGKNTTEAINKLAYRLPLPPGAVVLNTLLEHHSNDLPWRDRLSLLRASDREDNQGQSEDNFRFLDQPPFDTTGPCTAGSGTGLHPPPKWQGPSVPSAVVE